MEKERGYSKRFAKSGLSIQMRKKYFQKFAYEPCVTKPPDKAVCKKKKKRITAVQR